MVELTDREKKIIMIKFIIHGVSPYQGVSIELRGQMLEASLKTMGIQYTKSELLDLGEACIALQEDQRQSLLGFLTTNTGKVEQAIALMGKGGDRLKL